MATCLCYLEPRASVQSCSRYELIIISQPSWSVLASWCWLRVKSHGLTPEAPVEKAAQCASRWNGRIWQQCCFVEQISFCNYFRLLPGFALEILGREGGRHGAAHQPVVRPRRQREQGAVLGALVPQEVQPAAASTTDSVRLGLQIDTEAAQDQDQDQWQTCRCRWLTCTATCSAIGWVTAQGWTQIPATILCAWILTCTAPHRTCPGRDASRRRGPALAPPSWGPISPASAKPKHA